jgi:DNA polymerase-4
VSDPRLIRPAATLLHVDMDAFYASVEVLDDPSLAGLPLIVGGDGARGVVASCSYEARRSGVRSAMPSVEARRRCPGAVFRPGRFDRYEAISADLHAIFAAFTPLVEGIALDEAFLDVSGAIRLLGPPEKLAVRIRTRVADELHLSCSVGVASTKVVAKLASEAAKPRATAAGVVLGPGVVVVPPGTEQDFLRPLPVDALWGVGPVTSGRLRRLGISTVGRLADTPLDVLASALGASHGRHLHDLARGIDPRRVEVDREAKSIGHEETFARDRYDPDGLAVEVVRLSDAVADRLRAQTLAGRTVMVKVRFADFSTITRSRTLPASTWSAHQIARVANDLLAGVDVSPGVRLLGVSMAGLGLAGPDLRAEQLSFGLEAGAVPAGAGSGAGGPGGAEQGRAGGHSDERAWSAASEAMAEVRRRYGPTALGPAVLLGEGGLRLRRRGDAPWGSGAPGSGAPGSGAPGSDGIDGEGSAPSSQPHG